MPVLRRGMSAFYPKALRRPGVLKRRRVYNAPVARSVKSRPGRIQFGYKGRSKAIVVRNREYVCDVSTVAGASAFHVSFDSLISPVNGALFPWLSGIAGHFDTYSFKRLSFHYEPACTSATTGQVLIVPDYDPQDAAPIDWARGAAMEGANHCGAWTPLNVYCSSRGMNKRRTYYAEMPSIPMSGTQDVRECAVGRVSVCIENVSNNGTPFVGATSIGKLYVSYKVVLHEPDYSNYLSAFSSGVGACFQASAADITAIGDAGGDTTVLSRLNGVRQGQIPFTDNGVGLWTCTSPCELMFFLRVGAAVSTNAYTWTFTGGADTDKRDLCNGATAGPTARYRIYQVKFGIGDTIRLTSAAVTTLNEVALYVSPYPWAFHV